jgi:porphobilinogen synthase
MQEHIFSRDRRLRLNPSIREMVRETVIMPHHLIKPVFIHGDKEDRVLPTLPDSSVMSLTSLLKYIEKLLKLGILGVNLYPSLHKEYKDLSAKEALNPDGLIPQAIRLIKDNLPECIVIPDIALDPYTSHGHDGLVDSRGNILNDESVDILAKQSVLYASMGADYVAPSDMFDGRTLRIRQALDKANYSYVGIIAYAAKYASAYYGPFRGALNNDHLVGIDKRSYQLEPANSKQALDEVMSDINEGADMIMIKPAGHYLDIVAKVRALTNKPITVFQVSGECALIKLAAEAGLLDEKRAVMEQLLSMRRAGADIIFTYYAEKLFANN